MLKDVLNINYITTAKPYQMDSAFQYILKFGLTNLQNILLDHFSVINLKPASMDFYFTSAIMYNRREMLEKLMKYANSATNTSKVSGITAKSEKRYKTLCEILPRAECTQIFDSYSRHHCKGNFGVNYVTKLLLDLLGAYKQEFRDEIFEALQKIPYVLEFGHKYLADNWQQRNPYALEMLLDLGVHMQT